MRTTLNLLSRDGVVYMGFAHSLTGEQYAQLLDLIRTPETADDMREAVLVWGTEHGLKVSFDEMFGSDQFATFHGVV
ncbi:MAG TPA: hypothetical protein VMP01_08125 [Pirellulaceae bacterium]|nr:hypothetical protein [Pirellulaceae bacterium]